MADVNKVIEIAKAEVGYLEKASNKNLDSKTGNAGKNNYTKYARDLDNIPNFYNGKKNGYAWCDIFFDWCFVQAYGVEVAKKMLYQPNNSLGAGTQYSAKYYKNNNRFYSSPKIGDQIFFKNSSGNICHTGLVYAVDNNYVYTIEGNTSSASGVVANGGCVAKKQYQLSYSRIVGYGRPNYGEQTTTQPNPTPQPSQPSGVNYQVKVTANSGLNCRANPSASGAKITAYAKGTILNVTKEQNGWLYVNNQGWVSAQYTQRVTSNASTKPTTSNKPTYKLGNTYTLQAELKVRGGAGTNYSAKKHSQLTADGRKHDKDGDGALDKGTKVTCKAIKNVGNDIWIQTPSGWLAAYYQGKVYIK